MGIINIYDNYHRVHSEVTTLEILVLTYHPVSNNNLLARIRSYIVELYTRTVDLWYRKSTIN
jgi:hypothetical protein